MVSALLVLLFSGVGLCQEVECFVVGECVDSPHVGGQVAEDEQRCLELCKGGLNFKLVYYITLFKYFFYKL